MVPWQGLLSLKLTCKQLESLHRRPSIPSSPFFSLSPSPLVPFNALINIHKASHKGRLVPLNGLLFNGDIYLRDYISIQLQILSVILQLEQCMNKSIIWMQGEHLVLRGSASKGWGRGGGSSGPGDGAKSSLVLSLSIQSLPALAFTMAEHTVPKTPLWSP